MKPLRHLDSLTEEEINKTIRNISSLNDQITILIAHRLSTIMHADRIYVLERGEVVETGTHDIACWSRKGCIMPCGGSRSVNANQ
jgi:ABC-type multidrug transport system fused ATPase/permease subunit